MAAPFNVKPVNVATPPLAVTVTGMNVVTLPGFDDSATVTVWPLAPKVRSVLPNGSSAVTVRLMLPPADTVDGAGWLVTTNWVAVAAVVLIELVFTAAEMPFAVAWSV